MKSIISTILLFFSFDVFLLCRLVPNQTERYHNCFGTYVNPEGDKYVGKFENNEFHGQGTYSWAGELEGQKR